MVAERTSDEMTAVRAPALPTRRFLEGDFQRAAKPLAE
jgi:hypothetical protein